MNVIKRAVHSEQQTHYPDIRGVWPFFLWSFWRSHFLNFHEIPAHRNKMDGYDISEIAGADLHGKDLTISFQSQSIASLSIFPKALAG